MDSSLRRASLLALLLLALFAVSATAQTPPIRIMPMGDSITDGSSNDSPDGVGGYRGALYTLLTNAGYNVQSVGTLTINSQLLPDIQKPHEGHSGWRIDQLYDNVIGWFGAIAADPDVILLHIGTNDFGQNFDIVNAINRLDALITRMTQARPYAHIIVTNLMVRDAAHYNDIQTYFNPFVQDTVNNHANNGERVTFLDMNSVVPLSDMPDQLHPNQTGYNKMAAAWLPAIQAVIGPQGDSAPPALSHARGLADRTHVEVTFTKPVDDTTAANPANYAVDGGLTVSAAQLDATKRIVTLTTSTLAFGTTYTVTVNGVKDRIAAPNTIAANSTTTFVATAQRGYLNNVPEGPGYTLVYSLDFPNVATYKTAAPAYTIDNHLTIGTFDRVAYYLELQTANGPLQYAWVSMDASFTQNAGQLGVPTLASGAQFQQSVTGMNVISNVDGVDNGTNLTGNLEFWPYNYQQQNAANVPGADPTLYDFGDQLNTGGNYGSMQIHNTGAGKTVIAFNNWGAATTATPGNIDIGIGNNPNTANGRDWTFEHNGANYTVKSLQVFVRTTNDTTAPTITSANATFGATQIIVHFSEPLAPGSVAASDFTLDNGVAVLGARLGANQRDVYLTTTQQPASPQLTLSVSGIRDSSSAANLILPGSSKLVSAAALPPEIVANVGNAANGYQLVYSMDLPVVGNLNSGNRYTIDDHNVPGSFSRIAYYLELQTGNQTQYVWVAMDAFTSVRGTTGIPLASTGAIFQQNVTNMDVLSNVNGIVTGTGMTGGNIEFWPTNYSNPNGANVPNADANGAVYDFGDTRTLSGTFGCMQVHNHDASAQQTLFAINDWGADGATLDVGIGNSPVTTSPDWTFAANAGSYTKRTLHVLVLPGPNPSIDPNIVARVPEAANYQLVYTQNIPATGNLTSGTGFAPYTIDNHNAVGPFSRIAYYMELEGTNLPTGANRYVWVSMDAFTTNAGRIGIPNLASGAVFQQNVANMNVFSNVPSIVTGTGITTGNIEFWPTNYDGVNAANVPGANGSNFDFGDRATAGNYGSMQVHNYGAAVPGGGTGQTLFALNHWGVAGGTGALCAGIGNSTLAANSQDWTFADNTGGDTLNVKRLLQVYVLPVANTDVTGPTITAAQGSSALNRLVVSFNETLADSAATPANFSIPGLTITSATLLPSQRDVVLTTSAQTAGTVYTVNVTGVRDRSPGGNAIAAGASTTFTAFTNPALLSGIPDTAGYRLIYQLAIPNNKPQWDLKPVTYSVDESKFGDLSFDRVAYCLELKLATAPAGDPANFVYASFDTFTNTITKIGVPTLNVSATAIQQNVAHMNVASNVPAIVTGTDIATGYIEFWGGNYQVGNIASPPPNADATRFDWGDLMTGGGHGCMQIHNYGAAALDNNGQPVNGQTLFGYSDWGTNAPGAGVDQSSDLGIGTYFNNPNNATGYDWTFAKNTASYSVKNLYVLARPSSVAGGVTPTFLSYPVSRTVNVNGTASFAVTTQNAVSYQWRFNGTPIPGETNSWLTITGATGANAGSYDVVATGSGGATATSLAATLSVNAGGNTPPTAGNYSLTTRRNTAASIARAALVAKATDPDAGNTLTVSAVSPNSTQGGTVTLNGSNVIYMPANNFLGTDTFTFTISDGAGGTANGTATVSVTSLTPVVAGQIAYGFRGDGKFDVVFAGTAGQNYQLQRAIDLTAPSPWTTIQTLRAGDDGLLPCFDPAPPADHAFYRIILGP